MRTRRPLIALTFDDGPDPAYTPQVLELLERAGVHATFFLIGVNALAHPDLVRRIRAAGHAIGNHTFDHRSLERLSAPEVRGEIERGAEALQRAGATKPTLFRPPQGFTSAVVAQTARAAGLRTMFWGPCVERLVDHEGIEDGVERLLRGARPGTIVLAHDGGHIAGTTHSVTRQRTVEALPLLLDGLARRGLRSVTLPTLIRSSHTHRMSPTMKR